MTFAEWVAAQGRGAMRRVSRDTGLDYTTVWKAARVPGRRLRYPTARLISKATGGVVSVEVLCEGVIPISVGATDVAATGCAS